MPWTRKLSAPIRLDDGRTFTTLREAADFALMVPELHRANPHWQFAIEAMMQAAEKEPAGNLAKLDEAERRLKAALKAEGVLGLKRR